MNNFSVVLILVLMEDTLRVGGDDTDSDDITAS